MTNKVVIGILVFLVILSGGLCYYSYTLSQQIFSLGTQLTAFQAEQAARTRALDDDITTLRVESLARFSIVQNEMDETQAKIDEVAGDLGSAQARIGTFEDDLRGTITSIDELESQIENIAGDLSLNVMNASEIYQRVSQATVRIGDGTRTAGSGFILDSESHIATASHVVENLSEIYVTLPDGRVFKATSTGSSTFSDIAVLTINGALDIEPPPLADSSKAKIGEPVAAIGNPFELPETLTTGIISQTKRYAEIQYDSQTRWVSSLIQFDAAVNFGNSGGALFNASGEVIGMVIARVNPDDGDGIYYAVSSNKLKRVTAALIERGSFDYPWLGINITNLTPQTVQARNLGTANGVLVASVFANGPAQTAGIRVDDIIVGIDGFIVRDTADLTSYLGEHKSPTELSTIVLIRGANRLELTVEIGKRTS